jgi:hypothetical protein
VGALRRTEADGDVTCKSLSAECSEREHGETGECETTSGVHGYSLWNSDTTTH